MKIVHIIDYFQPQLGYQETFLPREQSKLGHEVWMVTSDRYQPLIYSENKSVLGPRIRGAGFFVEEGINVWRLRTLVEVPHAIWVRGLETKIKELMPDVVIVHGIVHLSALRIARLKKRLGNFTLIYDDHMTYGQSRSRLRVLYPLFKRTFSHLIQQTADGLVAVADACKVFMHREYGIPLERITVIPLGADDELFRFDASARQEIRSQLSIDDSDTLFIYTGKVIPEKRLDILVEAVKLMKNDHGAKVSIVGDGLPAYVERLKQQVRDAGLENSFIWYGVVLNKELYKYYSAADVAVWPSGPSISQREAMACGLPIVLSQDSSVTELVSYGNGLICRAEDAADLAKQMRKLLDPELRKEMGSNSRKFVEENLNWTAVARQFLDLP